MENNNEYQNQEQDRRIEELEKDRNEMKGHIATTNAEMGCIKTDVRWLKKFFWIVATASIGGFGVAIWNLVLLAGKK